MNNWIDISDQLPPEEIRVLGCDKDGWITTCVLENGKFLYTDGEEAGTEIRHWMRLPDAPQKKKTVDRPWNWISVHDNLPENPRNTWHALKSYFVIGIVGADIAQYRGNGKWVDQNKQPISVVMWMPLPKYEE